MTNQEYRALEDAFLARHDALCEEKSPLECPCKGMCDTLCAAEVN